MADTSIDGNTLKIAAYAGEEILVTVINLLGGPKSQQCWWNGTEWVCSSTIIGFVPSDAEKTG